MATLILQLDDSGAGILGRTLRDHGHRLRTVRLAAGDPLPPDLDDVQAIVVCGRRSGEVPTAAIAMIAEAHAAETPVIGLGDGAAVLASAIGGASGPAPAAGWHRVKLSATGREEAVLAGVAWTSVQLVCGSSGVGEIPKGAKVLANFEDGSTAAFLAGLRSYGFLPRLELGLGEAAAATRAAGVSIGDADMAAHLPDAERIARRVFEAIALFVAPLDRLNKGLAKDLHY
jgi:GMP synthase-like glutamine amidotransferase